LLQLSARKDLLWHNGIFFVGSLVASVLNYLYYPVLGRMLHPAAFGESQTLVSMFLQVAMLTIYADYGHIAI
jgi:O-antigen/teichoic acid export membrane protein